MIKLANILNETKGFQILDIVHKKDRQRTDTGQRETTKQRVPELFSGENVRWAIILSTRERDREGRKQNEENLEVLNFSRTLIFFSIVLLLSSFYSCSCSFDFFYLLSFNHIFSSYRMTLRDKERARVRIQPNFRRETTTIPNPRIYFTS